MYRLAASALARGPSTLPAAGQRRRVPPIIVSAAALRGAGLRGERGRIGARFLATAPDPVGALARDALRRLGAGADIVWSPQD